MNLSTTIELYGYGTSEGACKAVTTKGQQNRQACGGGSSKVSIKFPSKYSKALKVAVSRLLADPDFRQEARELLRGAQALDAGDLRKAASIILGADPPARDIGDAIVGKALRSAIIDTYPKYAEQYGYRRKSGVYGNPVKMVRRFGLGHVVKGLMAGGPGSGCNPAAAQKSGTKCGRPGTGKSIPSVSEHAGFVWQRQEPKAHKPEQMKERGTAVEKVTRQELAEDILSLKKRLKEKVYDEDRDKYRPAIKGKERKNLRQTLKLFKSELKNMKLQEQKEKKGLIPKDTVQILPKKARPSTVKQSFTSSKGFNYTVLKAPGVKPERGNVRDLESRPHPGKKRFTEFTRTNTVDKTGESLVYDWERPGGKTGEGTTVWIVRNYEKKRVTIHELRRGEHRFTESDTVVRFKNFGTASGFLNRRYGIKFSTIGRKRK